MLLDRLIKTCLFIFVLAGSFRVPLTAINLPLGSSITESGKTNYFFHHRVQEKDNYSLSLTPAPFSGHKSKYKMLANTIMFDKKMV